MLDLGAHLFKMSYHWQNVDNEQASNCTDESQYASNLRVKDGDEGGHQKDGNIYWVEDFICDFLVFKEQLKAERSQKVVDQRETTEKESE